MLTELELDKSVAKEEYKKALDPLLIELQRLQRQIFEAKVPVVFLFGGWEGAGKGDCINQLLSTLDSRGSRVYPYPRAAEEERLRPYLWRFWRNVPSRGQVAVFEQAWYYWLLRARVEGGLRKKEWLNAIKEIQEFERVLADDGVLIVKFWLHISRKEQRRRFKKWEKDPAYAFRVTEAAWNENENYDERLAEAEKLLAATHASNAPWVVVEGTDRRYRRLKVLETAAEAFRKALAKKAAETSRREAKDAKAASGRVTRGANPLDKVDLTAKLEHSSYKQAMDELTDSLRTMHHLCYVKRLPVALVFEGTDAAGKGGAIRRLTSALDPRGYTVFPTAAPEGDEKQKHYLWRFWRNVPKAGHWAIFDRSWYGRVLVERVEGFARPDEWKRAYGEIRDFERQLTQAGVVVLKFWLQTSEEEQLRRFKEREAVDYKRYKITDEDWRNREKWPHYKLAIADMLIQTSAPAAPWTVVEAEDKLWARVKVLRTVAETVRKGLTNTKGWREGIHL
jgi:polyphosphate:AMP phosphotransferase